MGRFRAEEKYMWVCQLCLATSNCPTVYYRARGNARKHMIRKHQGEDLDPLIINIWK